MIGFRGNIVVNGEKDTEITLGETAKNVVLNVNSAVNSIINNGSSSVLNISGAVKNIVSTGADVKIDVAADATISNIVSKGDNRS